MESQIAPKDRIVLPLDVSSVAEAQILVDKLTSHVRMFKIGPEFIYATVASLLIGDSEQAHYNLLGVRYLARSIGGPRAFMDVKSSDIPNTVGKATLALSSMGVAWINVHASAGIEAVKAAVANRGKSSIFGVTVLTSLKETNVGTMDECWSIFGEVPLVKVMEFALMLRDAGAQGIICSPKELVHLRTHSELDGMLLFTPGIRAKDAPADDQRRTMTAGEAILAGADYLVIGRPITKASDPAAAADAFAEEIRQASLLPGA